MINIRKMFDKAVECCMQNNGNACKRCPVSIFHIELCNCIPTQQDIDDGCEHEFYIKFEKYMNQVDWE